MYETLKGVARLLVLASYALSAGARGDSGPRIADESDPTGVRCAVASVYYRYDAGDFDNRLQTSILTSPDGSQVAVLDPRGVRILDLETGAERVIEGAWPVVWSRNSEQLILLDTSNRFFSYEKRVLQRQKWLDDYFADALSLASARNPPRRYFADHGLIAIPYTMGRILVADIDTGATQAIAPGWRRFPPLPIAELMIGWNVERMEPALFVAAQAFSGRYRGDLNPHEISIVNHIDVFRLNGTLEFSSKIQGNEVRILPLLFKEHTLVLSRTGETRCVNALARNGAVTAYKKCNRDIRFAHLDHRGEMLAAQFYTELEPHNELRFSADKSEVDGARLVAVSTKGTATYVIESATTGQDELVVVSSGAVKRRAQIGHRECVDRGSFPAGIEIAPKTASGFPAQAYLFRSESAPLKGLILTLHGGPRSAHPNLLTRAIERAWLARGYAIAAVNYRGGTGFGKTALEKPYEETLSGALEDVDAILRAAKAKLGVPDAAPVVLSGESFGAFLTILAAREREGDFDGFIVSSGICQLPTSVRNATPSREVPQALHELSEPDYALHVLRFATNLDGTPRHVDLCQTRIGGNAKIVMVHAEGDPIASYRFMMRFADAQSPERLLRVISNTATHDPFGAFAGNAAAIGKAADAILDFIEGKKLRD